MEYAESCLMTCPECNSRLNRVYIDGDLNHLECPDCGYEQMLRPTHASKSDPVSAPEHYSGDGYIECKDAMRSMLAGYDRADAKSTVAYWMTTALKYIWRAPLKNGLQDLKKARECIDIAIAEWGEDA